MRRRRNSRIWAYREIARAHSNWEVIVLHTPLASGTSLGLSCRRDFDFGDMTTGKRTRADILGKRTRRSVRRSAEGFSGDRHSARSGRDEVTPESVPVADNNSDDEGDIDLDATLVRFSYSFPVFFLAITDCCAYKGD